MSVTPSPGISTSVASGGNSTLVIPANPNGGFITNPFLAADQNITSAEVLYVDPTGATPILAGNGTCFALQPGQTWSVIPQQSSTTSVTSTTTGHKFSAVWW